MQGRGTTFPARVDEDTDDGLCSAYKLNAVCLLYLSNTSLLPYYLFFSSNSISLLGVKRGPFCSLCLPLVVIVRILGCNFNFKGILNRWGSNQGQDRLYDESSIECWNPCCFNSLHADLASVSLDVRVVNLCLELDLWGLEGIVVAEVNIYDKFAV